MRGRDGVAPSGNGRRASLPILMYHRIVDRECPDPAVDRDPVYDVSRSAFEKQMDYLADRGFEILGLPQLEDHCRKAEPLPFNGVIITFDDGSDSDARVALPVLERHGFRAEFFLTTDLIGRPGYVTWDDARRLLGAGMGIGSHSRRHVYLSDLDPEDAAAELEQSKSALEERLATEIGFFAPPGGRINPTVALAARRSGYRGICTSRFGVNDLDSDLFALCRIPVVGAMSFETFKDIVHQRRDVLRRYKTRAWIRDALKSALGNKVYDRIREAVLAK